MLLLRNGISLIFAADKRAGFAEADRCEGCEKVYGRLILGGEVVEALRSAFSRIDLNCGYEVGCLCF